MDNEYNRDRDITLEQSMMEGWKGEDKRNKVIS